jgi:hypothetical protein
VSYTESFCRMDIAAAAAHAAIQRPLEMVREREEKAGENRKKGREKRGGREED